MEGHDDRHLGVLAWIALTHALVVAATAVAQPTEPSLIVEIEGGAVWQQRNDVQIPNDETATRFSLEDVIGKGPYPTGRVYLTWNFADRHGLRLLLAPLSIEESGVPGQVIRFAGETFAAEVPTEAIYQFNSWRVSYRYRFRHSERWSWRIGFTAKIRDAKIELRQGALSARDTDVGFVPLAHLAGVYRFNEHQSIELDIDALAGGPGRAIDGSLKLRQDIGDSWSLTAGYRTVEGGADVDEVYNFAWLNYAVASLLYRF